MRVALVCVAPEISQPHDQNAETSSLNRFPSYGIRRVQAALDAGLDVRLFERSTPDVDGFFADLATFAPDVVGLASYVWSTPAMVELARRIKREWPRTVVAFGGPSARPSLLDLPPYAGAGEYCDAVVLGEGEETFRELVAVAGGGNALATVAGLALPTSGGGWHLTQRREPNPDMNTIPSPYRRGLMPARHVGYLETFRGCPLSCAFCQWGVLEANRYLSTETLVAELTAIKESGALYTYVVDAALNLHARAFRNFAAAEAEVGLFRDSMLVCEVYPNLLTNEHLAFLERTSGVHVGLGVQSLDPVALKANDRSFRPERLGPVIRQLSAFGLVDVEIILGLPGDTAGSFRRTLETCLELECNVRVYRCLVLPDALLDRAPTAGIRFDPLTLMMTSCHSWPERELRETQDYVSRLADERAGLAGDYWWLFVSSLARYRAAYPHERGDPSRNGRRAAAAAAS